MINSCSRCRVDSCHPLILLVVANSFHCASCRELSASAIRLSRSRLPLGLARLSLLILWRYSTSNPGEKMNCHACLIVESDCWFLWQHLYRFGFGVMGRRDFLIRTFFFFFSFSLHFEYLEEVIQMKWQCDRCSSIFPGWMYEWCRQRGAEGVLWNPLTRQL